MIIHPESHSVLLRAKNPDLIRNCLPGQTQEVEYEGHNIAVHYTLDAMKVLRNMGVHAPSPIRDYYNWPGPYTPFAHQIVTSEFLTFHRRAFVLSEMGTAKTGSAIWAADWLMQQKLVQKVLVIAPLSTLEQVWQREWFNLCMHRSVVILHGSAERRIELLASKAEVFIINYEGVEVILKQLRKRADIDLVIVDECAALRNGSTARYKMVAKLLENKQRLWMLSGTPVPNAPTDAWSQVKLVNPNNVPPFITTWKRMTMWQITQFKWVAQKGSAELVHAAMQPAIRFRKEDCLDLPPLTYETREAGITPEQKTLYKEMKLQMVAQAAKEVITAVNAADQIGKLRQILCGAVKDANGRYVVIPHAPRLNVLRECIEQATAKVLVVVPYKGIVYALADDLTKEGITCAVVNGDVPPKERNLIWHAFKNEENPRVALCHPQVMAHGLTLTEADMIVFYAPITSNELNQQVIERFNRPGQTRKMTVVRITANALEASIYSVVEGKQLDQQTVLDLYKQELLR